MQKNNIKIKVIRCLSLLTLIYNPNQCFSMAKILRASKAIVQTVPLNFSRIRTKEKVYIVCMTTGKFLVAEQILGGNVLTAIRISKIAYDLATAEEFTQAFEDVMVDEVTMALAQSLSKLVDRLIKSDKPTQYPQITHDEKEKINKQIESLYIQIIQRQIEVAKNDTKSKKITESQIDDLIDENSKNNVIFKEALTLAKEITLKLVAHCLDTTEEGMGYRILLNSIILPGISGIILDDLVKQINDIYFLPNGLPKFISKFSPADQIILKTQIKDNILNFAASCSTTKKSSLLKILQALQENTSPIKTDSFLAQNELGCAHPNDNLEYLINKIKNKTWKQKNKVDQSTVISRQAAKDFARLVAICQKDEYPSLTQKAEAQAEAKKILRQYTTSYDPNYSMAIFNFYHGNNKFLLSDKLVNPAYKSFENIFDLTAQEQPTQECYIIIGSDSTSSKDLLNPITPPSILSSDSLFIRPENPGRLKRLPDIHYTRAKYKTNQPTITLPSLKLLFGDSSAIDQHMVTKGQVTDKPTQKIKELTTDLTQNTDKRFTVNSNTLKKIDLHSFNQYLLNVDTGKKNSLVFAPNRDTLTDLVIKNYLAKIKSQDFAKEYYEQLSTTANAVLYENMTPFENMGTQDQAKLLHYHDQHYKKDILDRDPLSTQMQQAFDKINLLRDEDKAAIFYKAAYKNTKGILTSLKKFPEAVSSLTGPQIVDLLTATGEKIIKGTISSIKQLGEDIRTRKIIKKITYDALKDMVETAGSIALVGYFNIKEGISALSPREQYLDSRIGYVVSNLAANFVHDPTEIGNVIGGCGISWINRKAIGTLLGNKIYNTDLPNKSTQLLKHNTPKIVNPTDSLYKQKYINALLNGTSTSMPAISAYKNLPINNMAMSFSQYLSRLDLKSTIGAFPAKDLNKLMDYLFTSYILNAKSQIPQIAISDNKKSETSIIVGSTTAVPTETAVVPNLKVSLALDQAKFREFYKAILAKNNFIGTAKTNLKKLDALAFDASFDRAGYYSKIIPTHPNYNPSFTAKNISSPTFGFEWADFEIREKEKIIPSIINFILDLNKSNVAVRKLHQTFKDQEDVIQKDPQLVALQENAKKYVVHWLNQTALESDHPQIIQAIIKLNQFSLSGKGHIPYSQLIDKLNSVYFTKEGLPRDFDQISYKNKQELSNLIAKFYKFIATNKEQYINMLQAGADLGAIDFAKIVGTEKNNTFSAMEDSITWTEVFSHFLYGSKSNGISERILNNPANAKLMKLIDYTGHNHLDPKVNSIENWHNARVLCHELGKTDKVVGYQDDICRNLLHHYERQTFVPFFPVAREFAHDPLWRDLSQSAKEAICNNKQNLTSLHNALLTRYHKVKLLEDLFNIARGDYNSFLYKAIDLVDINDRVNYPELLNSILDLMATKSEQEKARIIETFFAKDGLLKPLNERLNQINLSLPEVKNWSYSGYLKNINSVVAANVYPSIAKSQIKRTLEYYIAAETVPYVDIAKIYRQLAELTNKQKSKIFVFGQSFVRPYSNEKQKTVHRNLLNVIGAVGLELNSSLVEARKVKIDYVLSLANIALRNIDIGDTDRAISIISNIERALVRDTEDKQSLIALTNIYSKYGLEASALQFDSLINYLAVTGLNDIKPTMLQHAYLHAQINAGVISGSYGAAYINESQKVVHEKLVEISDKASKFLVNAYNNKCAINNSYAILADLISRDCIAIDKLNRSGDVTQANQLLDLMISKYKLASSWNTKVIWIDNLLLQDGGSVPVPVNKNGIAPIGGPANPLGGPDDEETRRERLETEERLLIEKHKYEIWKLKTSVEKTAEVLEYKEKFVKHGILEAKFNKLLEDICVMVISQEDVIDLLRQIEEGYKFVTTIIANGLTRPFKFNVEHCLVAQRKPNGKLGGWHLDYKRKLEKKGRIRCIPFKEHASGPYGAHVKCPITNKAKLSTFFDPNESITEHLAKVEKILGSHDFTNAKIGYNGVCEVSIPIGNGYELAAAIRVATSEVTTWYITHPDFDLSKLTKS